jgi:transposase
LQTPRAISSTARRHGISRSLLLIWRRSFEANAVETELPKSAFVPAVVMGETAPPATSTSVSGRMVIEIGEHRRICSVV